MPPNTYVMQCYVYVYMYMQVYIVMYAVVNII